MSTENGQQYLKEVGERLRGVRLLLGLTQKQAAEATGISQSFLSSLERGQKSVCTAQIIALIRYYKVPYGMIFGSEDGDFNLNDFPTGGSSDISIELMNTLVGKGRSDALQTGTNNCLKLVVYMIFRTVYRENPRNSDKLFSLSFDDAMESVTRILMAAPENIRRFIRDSRSINANRFELPPERNPELRAFIAECERMILFANRNSIQPK
ncbi:helix-turn-helix transcriptional regulator [Ruminococcus sp.]|uniref:helix-turn-helix domain-containing protein n=1 Tax=Ruminococcus sp. TaxID=41978 RepID=UPI0025E0C865|nr:helix-turn-helix transcriptional regulator [Ruminococcus sp.]MBQ8965085.1 helix-turn-helix domain-containing protein [Ruminococcus sp.]